METAEAEPPRPGKVKSAGAKRAEAWRDEQRALNSNFDAEQAFNAKQRRLDKKKAQLAAVAAATATPVAAPKLRSKNNRSSLTSSRRL